MEGGYEYPIAVPTEETKKKTYETNAKVVNALLGSMTESKFVKVMQLNKSKEIWDIMIQSYEDDAKVKSAKLQTLKFNMKLSKSIMMKVLLVSFYV